MYFQFCFRLISRILLTAICGVRIEKPSIMLCIVVCKLSFICLGSFDCFSDSSSDESTNNISYYFLMYNRIINSNLMYLFYADE